jgi:predicted RNase H-like HicB family nuclease
MATIKTQKLSVSYYIVREGKYHVAYCPALELTSYGLTVAEAKRAFSEVLEIFIEETERKGTLDFFRSLLADRK